MQQTARIDIGRAIAESFAILKRHPVVLVPMVIAAVLMTLLYEYARRVEFQPAFTLHLFLLSLVMLYLAGVLIRMVYDATRGEASLSDAARVVAGRYGILLVATILYVLIVGVGTIALIIPGVFLGFKLFYYDYAIVIENAGIIGSLKRGWEVVRGNWWRTFALNLIFGVPVSFLTFIAEFVPAPGAQILNFVAVLGMGWLYAAFTIAFLELAGGGPVVTGPEGLEIQEQDPG